MPDVNYSKTNIYNLNFMIILNNYLNKKYLKKIQTFQNINKIKIRKLILKQDS